MYGDVFVECLISPPGYEWIKGFGEECKGAFN